MQGMAIDLSDIQKDDIIHSFRNGATTQELGARYGISDQSVRNLLRRWDIPTNRRVPAPTCPLSDKQMAKIKRLHKEGVNLFGITDELKMPHWTPVHMAVPIQDLFHLLQDRKNPSTPNLWCHDRTMKLPAPPAQVISPNVLYVAARSMTSWKKVMLILNYEGAMSRYEMAHIRWMDTHVENEHSVAIWISDRGVRFEGQPRLLQIRHPNIGDMLNDLYAESHLREPHDLILGTRTGHTRESLHFLQVISRAMRNVHRMPMSPGEIRMSRVWAMRQIGIDDLTLSKFLGVKNPSGLRNKLNSVGAPMATPTEQEN